MANDNLFQRFYLPRKHAVRVPDSAGYGALNICMGSPGTGNSVNAIDVAKIYAEGFRDREYHEQSETEAQTIAGKTLTAAVSVFWRTAGRRTH
jgi:hypothetical protein